MTRCEFQHTRISISFNISKQLKKVLLKISIRNCPRSKEYPINHPLRLTVSIKIQIACALEWLVNFRESQKILFLEGPDWESIIRVWTVNYARLFRWMGLNCTKARLAGWIYATITLNNGAARRELRGRGGARSSESSRLPPYIWENWVNFF